jgi:branched chain amino acid efflux pump
MVVEGASGSERCRAGMRRGLPFGVAVFAISISFGVLARHALALTPVVPAGLAVLAAAAAAVAVSKVRSSQASWITIAALALALATAAPKLAGPLALAIVKLLASALLAALVVVETFGRGRSLTVDACVLGAMFAVVALTRRAPMIVVVLGSAAVTALARLLI